MHIFIRIKNKINKLGLVRAILVPLIMFLLVLFFGIPLSQAQTYHIDLNEKRYLDTQQKWPIVSKETKSIVFLQPVRQSKKEFYSKYFHFDADSLLSVFKSQIIGTKDSILSPEHARNMRIRSGQKSFLSHNINRGIDNEIARLTGFEYELGASRFGGGYTWDEKNPAFVEKNAPDEGLVAGISYQGKKWNLQLSALASGQEIAGFRVGDKTQHYIMMGFNYQVTPQTGVSTMLRLQDVDSDQGVALTIGTRIRW